MRLIMLHPEVAGRDCGDCQAFVYDERTGERAKHGDKFIPRPKNTAPCRVAKCAKGTPEAPLGLNPRNMAAYQHYLECRAVGSFPDDSIVRLHAATIRAVEDSVQQLRDAQNGLSALRRAK